MLGWLRSGGLDIGWKRTQDAELVAFRIGEHNPGCGSLAHVCGSRTQADEPLYFGIVGAICRPQVQV